MWLDVQRLIRFCAWKVLFIRIAWDSSQGMFTALDLTWRRGRIKFLHLFLLDFGFCANKFLGNILGFICSIFHIAFLLATQTHVYRRAFVVIKMNWKHIFVAKSPHHFSNHQDYTHGEREQIKPVDAPISLGSKVKKHSRLYGRNFRTRSNKITALFAISLEALNPFRPLHKDLSTKCRDKKLNISSTLKPVRTLIGNQPRTRGW